MSLTTVIILGRSLLSKRCQVESVLNDEYVHFNIFGGRDLGLVKSGLFEDEFYRRRHGATSCHVRTEEENPGTYPGFRINVQKVMSGVKELLAEDGVEIIHV